LATTGLSRRECRRSCLADQLQMSPASIRQAKSRVLRRLKREVGDLLD
jgi:hypothetical protein